MRIDIAQKLRPFSHRPGSACLIPFTTWEVQIFPAKIFFHDLDTGKREEYTPAIKGPVRGFTVLLDLEKCRIEVFGKSGEGYFRYFISADGLHFKKGLHPLPFLAKKIQTPSSTRLSLGSHKKQDWELIQRRSDMAEVYPFWHRLAQIIPWHPFHARGTGILLAEGKLDLAFKAAFQGILSPRLQDENYLGIVPSDDFSNIPPIGHIHEGARQIQALFFLEEPKTWHILPKLPKEFHSGRLVHIETSTGDIIDLEWSKKQIQKVIIRSTNTHTIQLDLQSRIKSFRLRHNLRHKGKQLPRDAELQLQPNAPIYLDRFMH